MATKKKTKLVVGALFLLFLIVGTVWILFDAHTAPYRPIEGKVFGTFYHIQYQSSQDLSDEILREMGVVDSTFSTFNSQSIVSHINTNESVETTKMFNQVFDLAQTISKSTGGAFDITVGPLVNLWGFGKKPAADLQTDAPSQSRIDSLLRTVGYTKIKRQGNRIIKQEANTMLDFSAIAKGYACDAVAGVLHRHGVSNYMVEIGGEVRANGVNKDGNVWTVGIVMPTDSANHIEATLQMPSVAMATSGNYRNFYYKGGKKYAHTIDPRTGRPVQHSLLSATVIAPTCAEADGYATAFMVMGMEKAVDLLSNNNRIKAHLIYSDSNGEPKSWTSPKLEKYLNDEHNL